MTLSLVLDRVGVRSPAVTLVLWPSADLPVSDLREPEEGGGREYLYSSVFCID